MTRRYRRSMLLPAAGLLLLVPGFWPSAAAPRQAAAQAPAEAVSARVWDGRAAEFETFLRTAPIDRVEELPIGVTRPKRAFLKPGGLAASIAWKVLPPGRQNGYWESYKSEVAAYELDKMLGLGMVPVTVEKKWKYDTGAAVLWLTPVSSWKDVENKPKPRHWDRQVIRMKMFDNLICNKDRNAGNLLVDPAWNLFLIDHSRAFIASNELPVAFTRVDAELWERMLALDEPGLVAALGPWVARSDIRAILKRRDRMKTAIEALVKTSGEAFVFVRQ
jgi:hypothetical protein